MNRTKVMRGFHLVIALALTLSAGLPHVHADDTDVFFPANDDTSGQRNLLIILDNTANWSENSQKFETPTTGQAEVRAIKNAIANLDGLTSVGLMEFNNGGSASQPAGGFVRYHMRPMNDANKLALTNILDSIDANITDPNEKRPANTPYGDLFFDAYNYLSGGLAVFPGGVISGQPDAAAYDVVPSDFALPLTDANCGPTSIVFVTNPNSNGPARDTAENTARLALLASTAQMQYPNFTRSSGLATTTYLGATSGCFATTTDCTLTLSTSEYATQCSAVSSACACHSSVNVTTAESVTTFDDDSPTITVTNRYVTTVDPPPTVGSETTVVDSGVSTTVTTIRSNDTNTATSALSSCPAGQLRYSVSGITYETAPVSDNTVTTSATTSPAVTVCLKLTGSGAQTLPYATSCPEQTTTITSNSPASGQTTTVTTSWSNCAVPLLASQGGNCSASPGGSGSKTYTATGTKSVRTLVTNDSAPQTISDPPLGNTFSCYANSGSCSISDYTSPIAGSDPKNDCTDFNGGCTACTSPTTTTGVCPNGGNRFQVTGNVATSVVTPTTGSFPCSGGTCTLANLDEWARFLQKVGIGGRKINTHVIDVYKARPNDEHTALLLNTAKVGKGQYFSATSQSEIESALDQILDVVLDIDTTFAAPAVTVNTFNRLTNRDELYFALFKPVAEVKWDGNIKKYTLKQFSGVTKIADANNLEAVDVATGFFKSTAKSVWSDAVDGSEVSLGGAVAELGDATTGAFDTRETYTYTGADKPPAATVSPVDVSVDAHELISSNTTDPGDSGNITKAMVGLPSTAPYVDLTDILDWARGIDVDDTDLDGSITDARQSIGDPLHSQPVVITYKQTGTAPSIVADSTVYFGDNEGALHAVDTTTGEEIFAFTPKELLKNLYSYRNNLGDYKRRPYGLDGPITRRHKDLNSDLLVLNSDGNVQTTSSVEEFIHLYVGMRRGGRNYYSLDVTRRATPKLRWAIYGGSGSYIELGQTWSDAVVRKIKYKGATKDVIIFTGGYDPDADSFIKLKDSADQGRAVYIADADTGERLWWASSNVGITGDLPDLTLSSMKFSIPASPKVVDLDADGLADRIYVADSGGQIFRIILNAGHAAADTATNLATGSRIAMLSDADTAEASRTEANARRFFASPDVVLNEVNGVRFLAIAIGSGYRENPNNTTIEDRFYALKDPDFQKGPVNPLSIIESGTVPDPNPTGIRTLYDATDNVIGEGTTVGDGTGTAEVAQASLDAASGFYIKLLTKNSTTVDGVTTVTRTFRGEKIFTEPLTIGGNSFFASFTPNISSSACSVVPGQSRFYLLSVINGTPFVDYSNTSDPAKCATTSCDRDDRSVVLAQQGLPSDPALIFPSFGGGLVCIGSECNPAQFSNTVNKVHWLKRSD
ncbi:MAG: PilC/PilY family type IV pilus protein [Pseudomonadota bacterium]